MTVVVIVGITAVIQAVGETPVVVAILVAEGIPAAATIPVAAETLVAGEILAVATAVMGVAVAKVGGNGITTRS